MSYQQHFDTSAIANRFVADLGITGVQAVQRAGYVQVTIETVATAKRGAAVYWCVNRKRAELLYEKLSGEKRARMKDGFVEVRLPLDQCSDLIRSVARWHSCRFVDPNAIKVTAAARAEDALRRLLLASDLKMNARYNELRQQPRAAGEPGLPRYAVWVVQQFEDQLLAQLQRVDDYTLQRAASGF